MLHLALTALFCLTLTFDVAKAKPYPVETQKKYKVKCWSGDDKKTLLGFMQKVLKSRLEGIYRNDNYIQTFGCAYENDDIEQNSIRAVYRAIEQSLRNRGITARDNILGLLSTRPPRPDNLAREYTVYVNLARNSEVQQARYEIKVLDLQVVPTFESQRSVWTRIITRYAYQQHFEHAATPVEAPSEFVAVMKLADKILKEAAKGKFKKVKKLIASGEKASSHPTAIQDLFFGDSITLFSEANPQVSISKAIYIGKGICIADIPKFGSTILKFGEEHLYGLRIDTSFFYRDSNLFVNLQYRAPESVLQCMLLRYGHKKPVFNPKLQTAVKN